MSIYDKEIIDIVQTADQIAQNAANRVVKICRNLLNDVDTKLANVRRAVAAGGGKAKVAAKLETAEATELNNLYSDAKDLVEAYSDQLVDTL